MYNSTPIWKSEPSKERRISEVHGGVGVTSGFLMLEFYSLSSNIGTRKNLVFLYKYRQQKTISNTKIYVDCGDASHVERCTSF